MNHSFPRCEHAAERHNGEHAELRGDGERGEVPAGIALSAAPRARLLVLRDQRGEQRAQLGLLLPAQLQVRLLERIPLPVVLRRPRSVRAVATVLGSVRRAPVRLPAPSFAPERRQRPCGLAK